MDCKKLHSDIERLKSLRDELSNQLEAAGSSGLGKIALSNLSNEASSTADEILERYCEDLMLHDIKDKNHPNADFIKTINERLGVITDDTTINQIRNDIAKYLKRDLSLSSNLLAYALKEKSETNQKELDSVFNQLNLEPDKISEIMERVKNLEILETESYIFMLPKDKWEKGKIKLPNPENNSETPEFIAPNDLTAILKSPVYYDWSYETDGRITEDYDGNAKTLVYDEKWVGKEIHHFPWSKELIREANENFLKSNGYHIPEKEEWVDIYNNLKAKYGNDNKAISQALREDFNLTFSGDVLEGSLRYAGEYGIFRSASEDSANADVAHVLWFNSGRVEPDGYDDRNLASSIRCMTQVKDLKTL